MYEYIIVFIKWLEAHYTHVSMPYYLLPFKKYMVGWVRNIKQGLRPSRTFWQGKWEIFLYCPCDVLVVHSFSTRGVLLANIAARWIPSTNTSSNSSQNILAGTPSPDAWNAPHGIQDGGSKPRCFRVVHVRRKMVHILLIDHNSITIFVWPKNPSYRLPSSRLHCSFSSRHGYHWR